MRQKIAIDIDDVIVPLAELVCEYVFKASGSEVTPVELYSPMGDRVIASGLSEDEFVKHVYDYQVGSKSLDARPVEGAIESLVRLSNTHDVVFVTSRDPKLEEITHRWFDRHMGGLPFERQIIFVGNTYTGSEKKSKIEVCSEVGAQWLIDDHPKYVDQLLGSSVSVRGILFGDYGWNRDHEGDHFVKVAGWHDVVRVIQNG